MSVSELICDYIYNTFRLVEATMEVALRLASSLVTMLNAFVDSLFYTFKYVVDVALNAVLDTLKIIQKELIDLLWNRLRPETFCENMYKCSIILEDLADENSLIWKTCVKFGIIKDLNGTGRQQIYSILNDYNKFKTTICENGFTISFGIDAVKKMLDWMSEQVDTLIRFLAKKKEAARRTIQKFLDDIENLGIFDLLAKIRKYFNCILDGSDSCAHIASTSNYYNDTLSKLHIEESGSNGYRLETSLNNKIQNGFDARITQIDNTKGQIKDIIDGFVNPNKAAAADKAFDLSKNVFPSDLSWDDAKNMRLFRPSTYKDTWMKVGVVKYWKVKCDALYDAFMHDHEEVKNYNWSTDYFIGNVRVDDTAGKAYVNYNGVDYEYDFEKDPKLAEPKEAKVGQFTMNFNPDDANTLQKPVYINGNLISTIASGPLIAFDTEDGKVMKNEFKLIYERFPNTIPESELATSW